MVSAHTGCCGIQLGLPVNQKPIMVVPVAQQYLSRPPAIHLSMHWYRAPVIEITDDLHQFRLRRIAKEIDRPERIMG